MLQPTQPTNAPLQAQIALLIAITEKNANELVAVKNELVAIKNELTTPTPTPTPTTAKLSITDFANEYKISKPTIHGLMLNGAIPYEKIGRRTLFDRKTIELYFASKTTKKTKK